ncbi:MAG: OmpH family outer membrane protein [Bacteroidales bacterium]|nr:OmpH family outer membrane protein [Bacteroidales bacterium]
MKKIIISAILVLATSVVCAQRFAFVDSEYILSNIPEYNDAIEEIDDLSIRWQKEIEERFQEIDRLFQRFQAEAPLLSDDMRRRREQEIVNKEKEAQDLQRRRFGAEGDLFKKRQEMLRPIQDRVYSSIEKIAKNRNYEFVFDRSDNANLLYADTRRDISNEILNDMGLRPSNRRTIEVSPELQRTDPLIQQNTNVGTR